MKVFSQNSNRVWVKLSEDVGKKIELSKQVYSFIKDFRVVIITMILFQKGKELFSFLSKYENYKNIQYLEFT